MEPGRMPEQGALMKCVLCFDINQQLDSNCPECHGRGEYLQTARLMDRKSSDMLILELLATLLKRFHNDEQVQKKEIYHVLKMMKLYNFTLRTTLIEMYQELNESEELA